MYYLIVQCIYFSSWCKWLLDISLSWFLESLWDRVYLCLLGIIGSSLRAGWSPYPTFRENTPLKKIKTPGTAGFPCELYTFFFRDLSQSMLNRFKYSFVQGKLSLDKITGIINLIPKKDQNPLFLKNWRPISVLNTDYKLLAKSLALTLRKVVSCITSSDQTGFYMVGTLERTFVWL